MNKTALSIAAAGILAVYFISKKKQDEAAAQAAAAAQATTSAVPTITITNVYPSEVAIKFQMSVNGKSYNYLGKKYNAWGNGWRIEAGDGIHYFGGYSGANGKTIHLYIGHYEYAPTVHFVEDTSKDIIF